MKCMEEIKKSYCVKISLYESKYNELKQLADNLDVSLKKLVNISMKLAQNDYENTGEIKCCNIITIIKDEYTKEYNLKIKDKYYEWLRDIADLYDIKIKELVRVIIMYYPDVIKNDERIII